MSRERERVQPAEGRRPWRFHVTGERLCLDLANTVSWRASERPVDHLESAEDLVRWAGQAGAVARVDAAHLARAAERRPAEAARALARARSLREAIYRAFGALAAGRAPARSDMARLNAEVSEAMRHLRLTRRPDGTFGWEWEDEAPSLTRLRWQVARSAADVLTSDDLGRLKTCPSSDCGWIFLDTTRNGTRRWCDMSVCGNRAKARRYHARWRSDASRKKRGSRGT